MKKINVAIGKFGKVISFFPNKWGAKGGDPEGSQLILNLAQLHPEWTIYIVTKSDFSNWPNRTSFPNIIDVWDGYKNAPKITYKPHYDEEVVRFVEVEEEPRSVHYLVDDYMTKHDIKIDFALIYAGAVERSTIPNFMHCLKTPDKFTRITMHAKKYVGPVVYWLNKSKVPYFEIGEDVRYLPCAAYDLYHRPRTILTIQDWNFKAKHIKNENDETVIESNIMGVNVRHDLWFLANEKINIVNDETPRQNLISIFSNYSGNKQFNKEEIINKWIWQNGFEDAKVYGDWNEEIAINYPAHIYSTPMYQMNYEMYNTKFTIMLAGVKVKGGGVWRSASKFWKMLMFGIVPFFLPGDDDDRAFNAPEFLYVNSPAQLYERINLLNDHKEMYDEIRSQLFELLLQKEAEGCFNGSYIDRQIHNALHQTYGLDLPLGEGEISFKQSCIIAPSVNKTKALF